MSDWVKKTVVCMWLVASVYVVTAAVVFGLVENLDVRLAIGDVVLKACAPMWALLTAGVLIIGIARWVEIVKNERMESGIDE